MIKKGMKSTHYLTAHTSILKQKSHLTHMCTNTVVVVVNNNNNVTEFSCGIFISVQTICETLV
jgi:hypothetical protein